VSVDFMIKTLITLIKICIEIFIFFTFHFFGFSEWLLQNGLNGVLLGFLDETDMYSELTFRYQFNSRCKAKWFLYTSFLCFPYRALVTSFYFSKMNNVEVYIPLYVFYRYSHQFAPSCLRFNKHELSNLILKVIFERYGEKSLIFFTNDAHEREKKNVYLCYRSYLNQCSFTKYSPNNFFLTYNKAAFSSFFSKKNIKCCPLLVELKDVSNFDISVLPQTDLFIKPVKGGMGQNCFKVCYNRETNEFSSECMNKFKNTLKVNGSIGVFACLEMHKYLRDTVGVSTLCTLRIITHRFSSSNIKIVNRAHGFKALFRFTQENKDVDNSHAGGYISFVSSDGYLSNATSFKDACLIPNYPFCKTSSYQISTFKTGVKLNETRIPGFEEAKKLVKQAHKEAGEFVPDSVGWDVAVCDDGPVLLEANFTFYFGESMWY